MPPMVLAEGTMMPSEAREVILENLETGENEPRCPGFLASSNSFRDPQLSCHLTSFLSHRMVRGDPRAIVEYRDLDAPDDVDFF